ncbi:hypothetical protein BZA05DRAFT_141275 [Tricharina praecox]|uniref:uncharacterized protein n=1 Tax=Tricharina praecox TaxID=43433 RepID=UPI0022205D99|nr:uncharacterized protein BZA05DRAFT_141275 [Tricharina praecox]KAI5846196.1 hypothetical protein BZA05DRAFT_141275 [Tricharina praecox]
MGFLVLGFFFGASISFGSTYLVGGSGITIHFVLFFSLPHFSSKILAPRVCFFDSFFSPPSIRILSFGSWIFGGRCIYGYMCSTFFFLCLFSFFFLGGGGEWGRKYAEDGARGAWGGVQGRAIIGLAFRTVIGSYFILFFGALFWIWYLHACWLELGGSPGTEGFEGWMVGWMDGWMDEKDKEF